MKVGFIGLGVMGGPMALNLLKAGYDLTVTEIDKAIDRAAKFHELGADILFGPTARAPWPKRSTSC